jgi:DegV family protein with EDD domain
MSEVKLFTDSAADLSQALYKQYDISVVPFYCTFDKQNYYKELVDISVEEFFRRLRSDKRFPSTSLPSVSDYEEAFRPYLEKGMDIVCLCISSKFSGSYQSGVTAVAELKNEFPDRGIYVIDSIQASSGEGVMLLQMAKMKNAGWDAAHIAETVENLKSTGRVFFTIDSLEYLQKGGRIGKVSAFLGSLLNIKPIIVMKDAELNPVAKIRGRQKAIDKVISLTKEYVGTEIDKFDYLMLNAECYEEAAAMRDRLKLDGFKFEWDIQDLGVTIGCHTGPSVVGVCLIRRYDELGK